MTSGWLGLLYCIKSHVKGYFCFLFHFIGLFLNFICSLYKETPSRVMEDELLGRLVMHSVMIMSQSDQRTPPWCPASRSRWSFWISSSYLAHSSGSFSISSSSFVHSSLSFFFRSSLSSMLAPTLAAATTGLEDWTDLKLTLEAATRRRFRLRRVLLLRGSYSSSWEKRARWQF